MNKYSKTVVMSGELLKKTEEICTEENNSFSKFANNAIEFYIRNKILDKSVLSFDTFIISLKTKDPILNDFIEDYKQDKNKPKTNDYAVLYNYFFRLSCDTAFGAFKKIYHKYISFIERD